MGSRVTKNVSALQGRDIVGHTFELLCDFTVMDNTGHLLPYSAKFMTDPSSEVEMSGAVPMSTVAKAGTRVRVRAVYRGDNIPDGNKFYHISGEGNVLLDELFLPHGGTSTHRFVDADAPFRPNPRYLRRVSHTRTPLNDSESIPLPLLPNEHLLATVDFFTPMVRGRGGWDNAFSHFLKLQSDTHKQAFRFVNPHLARQTPLPEHAFGWIRDAYDLHLFVQWLYIMLQPKPEEQNWEPATWIVAKKIAQ